MNSDTVDVLGSFRPLAIGRHFALQLPALGWLVVLVVLGGLGGVDLCSCLGYVILISCFISEFVHYK